MQLGLQSGAKVGGQLTDRVDCRPAYARVHVAKLGDDRRDDLLEHLCHLRLAPLARLRDGHQRRAPLLPVGRLEPRLDLFKEHWHHRLPAKRDRQAVERLLANVVIGHVGVVLVVILALPLGDLRRGVAFDLEHHPEGDGHCVRAKVLHLARERRRVLGDGQEEFAREVAERIVQLRVPCDRDHPAHARLDVPLEKLGVLLCNLDKDLERVSACVLLLTAERVGDRLQHEGHEVLELMPRRGVLESHQK